MFQKFLFRMLLIVLPILGGIGWFALGGEPWWFGFGFFIVPLLVIGTLLSNGENELDALRQAYENEDAARTRKREELLWKAKAAGFGSDESVQLMNEYERLKETDDAWERQVVSKIATLEARQ